MRTRRPNDMARKTVERPCVPSLLARTSEPESGCLNHSLETRPVDWDQAMCAAAARLNEGWLLPETGNHPAVAELVWELAALMCAYGLVAEEVGRGPARASKLPILKLPTREHRCATLWGEPPW